MHYLLVSVDNAEAIKLQAHEMFSECVNWSVRVPDYADIL